MSKLPVGADALALRAPLEVELLAVAREENAVELVVREAREIAAALELAARQRRIADQHAPPAGAPVHAETDLAPVGDLAAEVQPALTLAHAVLGDAVAIAQLEHAALLEIELRRDEVAAGQRQRLVELGEELRVLADLHVGEPFAAEPVQLGGDEAQRRVVTAVALEVVFEVQADAHVVRAPALAAQVELQAGAALVFDQLVVDRLEAVERVQRRQLAAHQLLVERACRPGRCIVSLISGSYCVERGSARTNSMTGSCRRARVARREVACDSPLR